MTRTEWAKRLVAIALGLCAAALCWEAVSWALQPGLFPMLDELGNRGLFLDGSYHQIVHFFPAWFYNDRPFGWMLERLLFDLFGFDYAKQVACFLVIHFANCVLAFALFRRLGASTPISISGVALFGSLWTTADTATFLGASFDVMCLFFLLASTLALLAEWRGASTLSAVLFLAALRTKEFAIVTPLLFTVLLVLRLPRMPPRAALSEVAKRLWLHYLILIVFGLRYLSLYRAYRAALAPNDPYRMNLHAMALLKSIAYYVSLIFGAEDFSWQFPPALLAVALGAVLGWAIFGRRAGLAFGVCAFVLTLLPVCLIANRASYYVYAPQLFLILVLGLLLEDALAIFGSGERLRWAAQIGIAIACLSWCAFFQSTSYFTSRIDWELMVRTTSARTAREAEGLLPRMGPGTHVYVNHDRNTTPWLFLAGTCSYLKVVNMQRSVFCIVNQPPDQLRKSYASDHGPKFFVEYYNNGVIALTGASN
jgi:hypothetical protein